MPQNFVFTTDEEFEVASMEAEAFYKTLGDVWCPYFAEKIAFNVKGWQHLKFKAQYHARSRSDQYGRFKLLPIAPEILRKSHTVQGVLEAKVFENVSVNSRQEKILKEVTYWEFVAVLNDLRTCVIVKEIDGSKYFWSVIPFWEYNPSVKRRLLHNDNPEAD